MALPLALVVSVYFLYLRRAPIPEVPAKTRTAPDLSKLPPIRVCWIENGDGLGSTMSALLVRHPGGDVLIDAGNSSHIHEEIRPYGFGDWLWLRSIPGAFPPKPRLDLALLGLGVDPAKLAFVIPTHAHVDHVGGLMDLPEVPVLLLPEELALVAQASKELRFEVMPAHAALLARSATPLKLEPNPYEVFDAHADLFGDGSIVVVPLRGHTPGSVGVFVNISPEKRLFHIGDATHDARGLRERLDKPRILQRTDSERENARRVVAELHAFAAVARDVMVLPAHARSIWVEIFGAPGCLGETPR
jgi:N-acyl homoserine lactone hydrolase